MLPPTDTYSYTNMRTPTNLAELIAKYEAGTASPEELMQLNEWYHSFDDNEVRFESAEAITEAQMAARIYQRLDQTIGFSTKRTARRIMRRRLTRVAAAALVLLIGATAYLLLKPSPKPVREELAVQEEAPATDIAPGGNKALLTLANGTTIVLDSAANGTLGTQGSIKVEKLDNGLLAYQLNGKTIGPDDEAFYNTISTPRGGQYQVTLSDGTRVWLNAASSIRFPVAFTGSQRRVEVTGETYFEVAHNAQQPFVVKAASTEVEVLGTHFNINAYADEASIKTTLLEGKVKISAPGTSTARYLQPGQQAGIGADGKINVLVNADTEEAVAWIKGRFQFSSADLRSILRQISRWYDVDVEYKGNVDLHFTGQLTRNENVSSVFEKLQLTGEVRFRIEGRKIIVSR